MGDEVNPDPYGTYWLSENDGSVYFDGPDGPVDLDESMVVRLLNETEIERDVARAALRIRDAEIERLQAQIGDKDTPGTLAYDAETARLIDDHRLIVVPFLEFGVHAMGPCGESGEGRDTGEAVRAAVEGESDGL